MTLSPRAIEAALSKFNKVINDPIMEPCPRCEAKGYHHGFGPGGVEPDWCENCGGNQYNIRPGEEKRAMEAALTAALAVDGVALVDQRDLDWLFGEGPDRDGKWFGETIGDGVPKLAGKYPRTYWWRTKFRAMLAAASDREERR